MIEGDTLYIEEDGDLISVLFNGMYKDNLSVIYTSGPKKGHSEFIKEEDIVTDINKWYEEKERIELNLQIKEKVLSLDCDLQTARALAKFLKI